MICDSVRVKFRNSRTVRLHLKKCPACTGLVSFVKEFIAEARENQSLQASSSEPHPDAALIVGLEADNLDEQTARKVGLHLLDCKTCREAYLQLRSLSNEQFEERVLEKAAAPSSWPQIRSKAGKNASPHPDSFQLLEHSFGQLRIS